MCQVMAASDLFDLVAAMCRQPRRDRRTDREPTSRQTDRRTQREREMSTNKTIRHITE